MRGRLLGVVLAVIALLAAAAPGAAAQGEKPFSNTVKPGNGHVLTYSLTGVEAVPAGEKALEGLDGIIRGAATVTFSGSMTFSIGAGAVTNLSMSASLSGDRLESQTVKWTDPTPEDGAFYGPSTATLPFTLTAKIVLPPPPTTSDPFATATTSSAALAPVGRVSVSAETRNCNDSGVCDGAGISFSLAVVAAPPTVTKTVDLVAIIGAIAAVAAIAAALFSSGKGSPQHTHVRYVLQVAEGEMQVGAQPSVLHVQAWKVASNGAMAPAPEAEIDLQPPPGYLVTPSRGVGSLVATVTRVQPPPPPPPPPLPPGPGGYA